MHVRSMAHVSCFQSRLRSLYDLWCNLYLIAKIIVIKPTDNPRYVEANAGCKHFDVYAGPDDSRNVFDAKV